MLIDRATIPYLHWQPKSGLSANGFDASVYGKIVHGEGDVEQAIASIIRTQKGTVPLAPEMCCDLASYVDLPPSIAIPNLTREIFDALRIWEPRIVVTRVDVKQSFSQLRFGAFWYLRADVSKEVKRTDVTYV